MAHDLAQRNPPAFRNEKPRQGQIEDNHIGDLSQPTILDNYKISLRSKETDSENITNNFRLSDPERQLRWSELIDQHIAILTESCNFEGFEYDLAYKNAKLRVNYLSNTEFVTLRSSVQSTQASNSILSKWEQEQLIFSVNYLGQVAYPAFQFADNRPKAVIEKILKELPTEMSSWQIAFWFESNNGWVGGERPKDCLDKVEQLVKAAQQEALAHCF